VGQYEEKKFSHFIDDILSEFSFKTVQYVQDAVPKNEAGVLFKHRHKLLTDNPYFHIPPSNSSALGTT
jgi:hypothetical protein